MKEKHYGTRPSSIGSQTSVMLTELMFVSWCNPGILFCFRIKKIVKIDSLQHDKHENKIKGTYLDNLCYSNRLTDCLSHGLQNNLFNLPILVQKKRKCKDLNTKN
jgi:hypothetical protein